MLALTIMGLATAMSPAVTESGQPSQSGPTATPLAIEGAQASEVTVRDSWRNVQELVRRQLAARDDEERDIGAWARELDERPLEEPVHVRDVLMRIEVYLRAGRVAELAETVGRLCELDPPDWLTHCLPESLARRGHWTLVRRVFDAFPEAGHADLKTVDGYIKRWSVSAAPPEIDAWLAHKAESPNRFDSWFSARVRYRIAQGTGDALYAEVVEAARANPSDARAVQRLVDTTSSSGGFRRSMHLGDLGSDKLAILSEMGPAAAYWFAENLRGEAAIRLYELSLELPFTEVDEAIVQSRVTIMAPAGSWEPQLRHWTRSKLSRTLREQGDVERAQAIMLELADSTADGIPPAGYVSFSGQTQAAAGAHVVEDRIADAEQDDGDSPQYWLTRAAYYGGRGDVDARLSACLRVLELTPTFDLTQEQARWRSDALFQLVDSLIGEGRTAVARELAMGELEPHDPLSSYSYYVMWEVQRRIEELDVNPLDERIWCVLATRRWEPYQFDGYESLAELAEKRDGSDAAERIRDRVRAIAAEDPERSFALGNALSWRRPDEAVRWLQTAVDGLPLEHERQSAASQLVELYLEEGRWRDADRVWSATGGVRTGRLAALAARDGAFDDALRIWREVAGADRLDLGWLPALVGAGMGDELTAFYEELAAADPTSHAPARALQRIEAAGRRRHR